MRFFVGALAVGALQLSEAAPWQQLSRPLAVPAGHMQLTNKRAASSDPSCPEGYICELDLQSCPTGTICPTDTVCINFGGTLACAPALGGLSWCAIDPTSFEAVGCPNGGRCCHGQCYLSDSVCCDNPTTRCTLGTLCNVCPQGKECGSNASCLDPTPASSSIPVTPTPTSTQSSAPPVSTVLSSTPPSSTEATSTPNSSATSSAPEPTGTADLAEILRLLSELSDEYFSLTTESSQIVKALDKLARDREEGESGSGSGLQARQDTSESSALENRLDQLRSRANALLNPARNIQSGLRAIPEGEWHQLTEVRSNALSQASELESHATRLASAVEDILRRNIGSLGPSALKAVRDLARNTLVRRVALGLTALNWLLKSIGLARDILSQDPETAPTISIVIPPTPTTTPVETPTQDPAVPPTSLPDEYLLFMAEETTTSDFRDVVHQIVDAGDLVLSYIAHAKAQVWYLWVVVSRPTLLVLDANRLIVTISRNAKIDPVGASPTTPRASRSANATNVQRMMMRRRQDHHQKGGSWQSSESTNTTLHKRAPPSNFVARATTVNGVRYPYSVPSHLTWVHSIWHKEYLEGTFYEIPDYWYESSDLIAAQSVPIYLIDTQVDWQHPELTPSGARLGYPGHDCGTMPCANIRGTEDPYHGRAGGKPIYHGSEMAALITGDFSGVNPRAELRPLAIPDFADAYAAHVASALGQILIDQADTKSRAILSASWGFLLSALATQGLTTPSDFFESQLEPLTKKGVTVIAASGNSGETRGHESYALTPQYWSGDQGRVTSVGACDFNSLRASFSSFVANKNEPVPNHRFPDIYNIGTQILVPRPDKQWHVAQGTSHAAALTSGLLSVLIAREPDGTKPEAGQGTKRFLKDIALDRKSSLFPPDNIFPPGDSGIEDPGSVDEEEAYRAPRAATNWEVECEQDKAGAQVLPVAYSFLDGQGFTVGGEYFQAGWTSYLELVKPRCVLSDSLGDPKPGQGNYVPFPIAAPT